MFKQYLRHSRAAEKLLKPLLRSLPRITFPNEPTASDHFREAVVGGSMLLAPKNIDGQFEVSARSELAVRVAVSGSYEPDVTAALMPLKLQQGMIINVGANIGFYSVFLARAFPGATKVLAVEPNPEAYRLLAANIDRNGLAHRIEAVQACIGASEGTVELSVIQGMPEYSSLGGIVHPGVVRLRQTPVLVPVVPLAKLIGSERVALMFVDTEGAEASVFEAAREVIVRDKPVLFFECSSLLLSKFGSSTKELEQELNNLGYVVRNGLCPRLPLRHPYEGEAIAFHSESPKR
jgi:FkbM family methyltransferase